MKIIGDYNEKTVAAKQADCMSFFHSKADIVSASLVDSLVETTFSKISKSGGQTTKHFESVSTLDASFVDKELGTSFDYHAVDYEGNINGLCTSDKLVADIYEYDDILKDESYKFRLITFSIEKGTVTLCFANDGKIAANGKEERALVIKAPLALLSNVNVKFMLGLDYYINIAVM